MQVSIRNVAFDCADPYRLAQFWSQVLDAPMADEDGPGDPEVTLLRPGGPNFYFQRVAEPKAVKNRVHVCLQPDILRDSAVDRIVALGATMRADRREPDGTGWAVLADPEGNEFCVLRSAAERPPAQ